MNSNIRHEPAASGFYGQSSPDRLIRKYGGPLFVYNESILRQRCREMKQLVAYPHFSVYYSAKANSNMELLRIVREEGLNADAMSPGEMYVLLQSGFRPEDIFFVGNNVSHEEMRYAVERGIPVSVDSLSQLELFGSHFPGRTVSVRLNPGVGVGHHEKVVTAGKNTKFGIEVDKIDEIKRLADRYHLQIIGVNQHLGSLFLEPESYLLGAESFLNAAARFEGLRFVDLGGGFGIPYHKQDGEGRLDLQALGARLDRLIGRWMDAYGKSVEVHIEPGRYIPAESGVLLGTVHSVKQNGSVKYIGTDLGFNVLARPVLYDSWHDLEFYREAGRLDEAPEDIATVVGNICETGDIIARNRRVPFVRENDVIAVMDAGAYGFSMSSNYNNRLRPAEVLIREDGTDVLIRRRETLDDLLAQYAALQLTR